MYHISQVKGLDKKELYFCRGDYKGIVFDRKALQATATALGININDTATMMLTMPSTKKEVEALLEMNKEYYGV